VLALIGAEILLNEDDRPRFSSCKYVFDDRKPKNIRGDHWAFSDVVGESDRAVRCFARTELEVFRRGNLGVGGAARGVMNLSAGFMVLMSPFAIELIEALRKRKGWTSTGTQRRLTG
jgi:hypothetical protein